MTPHEVEANKVWQAKVEAQRVIAAVSSGKCGMGSHKACRGRREDPAYPENSHHWVPCECPCHLKASEAAMPSNQTEHGVPSPLSASDHCRPSGPVVGGW